MELLETLVLLTLIGNILSIMLAFWALGKALTAIKLIQNVSPKKIIEEILSTKIPVSVNMPGGGQQFTPPMPNAPPSGAPNPLTG